MRSCSFALPLCLMLLLNAVATSAAPSHPYEPLLGHVADPARAAGKTDIVTDEKAHVVRVFIDGKEVLLVDSNGLHVRGDVSYSGTITDMRPAKPNPTTAEVLHAATGTTGTAPKRDASIPRIPIDAKEVVTVESSGLHVSGDLTYSGVVTDTGPPSANVNAGAVPKAGNGKTEIVTEAHAVRTFIDGKEVLTVDSKGLHVNGDIVAYSEIDTGNTDEAR